KQRNINQIPKTRLNITPASTINQFTIHFEFEYMKEDVGPTTEFPCRKKIIPNAEMTIPQPIIGIPILISQPFLIVLYFLLRTIASINDTTQVIAAIPWNYQTFSHLLFCYNI